MYVIIMSDNNSLFNVIFDIFNIQSGRKPSNNEYIISLKKKYYSDLSSFIDYRIGLALDARRSQISQERVAAADSINSAIKTASSTIKSISALNSAPLPPTKIDNVEELKKWIDNYTEWYNTKRRLGVTIE